MGLTKEQALEMLQSDDLLGVGMENSPVTTPAVVIRPILFALLSVNHRAPSGPVVMQQAPLFAVGMENSVTVPVVVIRPILL